MLIGIIGAPNSGKTTVASAIFAKLKELGISTEFLVEQARIYIAEKKNTQRLTPTDTLKLTDWDQSHILHKQYEIEKSFKNVCGQDVAIITDSSIYNTLLYMSDDAKRSVTPFIMEEVGLNHYDILFLCQPVPVSSNLDPNRIHNEKESLAINDNIPNVITNFIPKNTNIINLTGNMNNRFQQAISEVTKLLFNNHDNKAG